MKRPFFATSVRKTLASLAVLLLVLASGYFYLYGQDKSDFPDGFDALQAAPKSHKLIFENAFVRVLEVDVPPAGQSVPMHHHRWPSLVIDWDTGGGNPHVLYHRPGQPVRDIPSHDDPSHPGLWRVHWMGAEPMHSIEVVSWPKSAAEHTTDPPELRVEIKTHP